MSAINHPFVNVCRTAKEQIQRGATVYQKFTCAGCGQRLTMDVPNTLYETGTCDQCDTVTDIKADGCNLLVHYTDLKGLAL